MTHSYDHSQSNLLKLLTGECGTTKLVEIMASSREGTDAIFNISE